jgi:hypothetical protein
VAAIILDHWLRGRRRAVWLSKSDKLIEDARRDWIAVGGRESDIQPLSAWKQGKPVTLASGILFVTYATLRTTERKGKASRLRQLVGWLGHDFDGVIVFDEAHAMANAAGEKSTRGGKKPSLQGQAGLRLQNAVPAARVVYVSATGATRVANLAYASRLGLWQTGDFPFASRSDFIAAVESGGIAAMEMVCRDLKALGLYAARNLSFNGVEYAILEYTLTEAQVEIYDRYADAFQILWAAAHKTCNREVAVMRRSATRSRSFADFWATSFTLFLLSVLSKSAEPSEQTCIPFPGRRMFARYRSPDLFQRFSLGFEIGLGVVVGCVEADMPEPTADDGDVDACRDKVNGGRVPEAVRCHMLRTKRRRRFSGRFDVGRELEPHARGAQWFAVPIHEDALAWRARLPLQQLLEQRHGFRPERTEAFLAPLAIETHAVWCFEPDRLGTQIERLLDTRAAVIEDGQQHMVAHPFDRRSVGLCEDCLDLPWLKVAGCGGGFALERDREDLCTLRDVFKVLVRHEAEEATDRRKPAVARADRALTRMFGMAEERANLAGRDIGQGDPCDPAAFSLCDEPEQQPPGVPVGLDRMDRGTALLGQPLLEERPQQCGERVARFHDSASMVRHGAPTARNRSLASCSRSCVTVM